MGRAIVTVCGKGVPLLANGIRSGEGPVAPVDTRLTRAPATPGAVTVAALDELEVSATARGRAGLAHLRAGLADRDPRRLRRAADALTGLGPGLTPEGDDALAGAALAFAGDPLAGALVLNDLATRTTPLSATLLRLAAIGAGPEPLRRLAAGDAAAGPEIASLGATSGRALLAAFAAAVAALQPSVPSLSRTRSSAV